MCVCMCVFVFVFVYIYCSVDVYSLYFLIRKYAIENIFFSASVDFFFLETDFFFQR